MKKENENKKTFAETIKQKKVFIPVIAGVLAVAGLGIGLGVGLSQNKGDSPAPAPEPTTYTVTFNMMGHGEQIEPIVVEEGAAVAEPDLPVDQAYNFVDWYADEECTTSWNFEDVINADMTIYVGWDIKTFYVFFDTMDMADPIQPMEVEYGSTVDVPDPVAFDPNYEFGAWYRDPEYTKFWNVNLDVVTSDVTLYAKWFQLAD